MPALPPERAILLLEPPDQDFIHPSRRGADGVGELATGEAAQPLGGLQDLIG